MNPETPKLTTGNASPEHHSSEASSKKTFEQLAEKISADGKLDELNKDILEKSKAYLDIDTTSPIESIDVSVLDGLFLNSAALLKTLLQTSLRDNKDTSVFSDPKVFLETGHILATAEEQKLFGILKSIYANKETNPTLYNAMFSQWGASILQLTTASKSEMSTDGQLVANQLKEKIDKIPTVIKTVTGAMGVGAAIWLAYNMIKGEGGWFGNLLKGAIAVGGLGVATGWNLDFSKWFGGDKDAKDKPTESGDKSNWIPLKDAWKNYENDMSKVIHPLKEAYVNNKTGLAYAAGALAIFTDIGRGMAISSAKLAAGNTLELAKLPFRAVSGFSAGKVFFALSAIGVTSLSADSLANIKIPPDTAGLTKELRDKITIAQEKAKLAGEEVPQISDKDIDTIASILKGDADISKYIDPNNILLGTAERIGQGKMDIIETKSKQGLDSFKVNIEGLEVETGSSFPQTKAKINEILENLPTHKRMNKYDLQMLNNVLKSEKTGIELHTKGDYIWATIPNPEEPTMPKLLRIGIHYKLSKDEAHEAARNFITQGGFLNSAGQLVARPFEDAREQWTRVMEHLGGEKGVVENLTSGTWGIAKVGSELAIVGAGTYHVMGPLTALKIPLTALWNKINGKGFDAMEAYTPVANGALPVLVYRVSVNTLKTSSKASFDLFSGQAIKSISKALGLSVIEAATYPISSLRPLSDVFISHVVAPYLKGQPVDPKIAGTKLKADFFSSTQGIQNKVFGSPLSPFYSPDLATRYKELSEANEAIYKLAKARLSLREGSSKYKQIEDIIKNSTFEAKAFKGYTHKNITNGNIDHIIENLKTFVKTEKGNVAEYAKLIKQRNVAIRKGDVSKAEDIHKTLKSFYPDMSDFDATSLKRMRRGNMVKGGAYSAIPIALGGLFSIALPAFAGEKQEEKEFGAAPKEKPSEKKKPNDVTSKERTEMLASNVLAHFHNLRESYAERMGRLNPEELRKMDTTDMITLVNGIIEDHSIETENLKHYVKANKEIILNYLAIHPEHEGVIGNTFKLNRVNKNKDLQLEYASGNDIKLLTYDTLDAVNTALFFEKWYVSNQYGQMGIQMTVETLPITGTILDANRLFKSIQRGQNTESIKNAAFLGLSALSEVPLLKFLKGPRIAQKSVKMQKILKFMSDNTGKVMGSGMAIGLGDAIWRQMKPDRSQKAII